MAHCVREVCTLSRGAMTFHVQTQESVVWILWIHGPMIGRPIKQTVAIWTILTGSDLKHFDSMFNMVWFVRTITALDWGWKDVVQVLLISNRRNNSWKKLVSKLRPSSVCMLWGNPKRQIQWFSKASAVVSACWLGCGIASYHLVKCSPINKTYWQLLDIGRGPRKSNPKWRNV